MHFWLNSAAFVGVCSSFRASLANRRMRASAAGLMGTSTRSQRPPSREASSGLRRCWAYRCASAWLSLSTGTPPAPGGLNGGAPRPLYSVSWNRQHRWANAGAQKVSPATKSPATPIPLVTCCGVFRGGSSARIVRGKPEPPPMRLSMRGLGLWYCRPPIGRHSQTCLRCCAFNTQGKGVVGSVTALNAAAV
jgi:hypothetical protein